MKTISKNTMLWTLFLSILLIGLGEAKAHQPDPNRCRTKCKIKCKVKMVERCYARQWWFGSVCSTYPKRVCFKRCKTKCIKPVEVCKNVQHMQRRCGYEPVPEKVCEQKTMMRRSCRVATRPKRECELYTIHRKRCKTKVVDKNKCALETVMQTKCRKVQVFETRCRRIPIRKRKCKVDIYGEMHRYIPVIAKRNGFTKISEKEALLMVNLQRECFFDPRNPRGTLFRAGSPTKTNTPLYYFSLRDTL